MYDAVKQAITSNNPLDAYFLADGNEQPIKTLKVYYDKPFLGHYQLHLREYQNAKYGNTLATVSQIQVEAFFNLLKNNEFTYTDHKDVKKIDAWKEFYGYKQIWVEYIDKLGNKRTANEWAVPCRYCGLVTHEKLITVDHQNPQTGGETYAVLKVFRGLGLTMKPPKGPKALSALKKWAAPVGGTLGTTDTGKYRLNQAGTIYYSIIKAANELGTLREKCMHSYLNLSPMCSHCNSSKSNRKMEF